MTNKPIDTVCTISAWFAAVSSAIFAIVALWLSRHQPIEMDLAMMHYSAFLINEKHLLLYRDIFENNLPGPFFFHSLIGNLFGYGPHPIRFLDGCVLLCLTFLSWHLLSPISKASAVLAPTLFAIVYFTGGTVAAFQRDYIAIVPLAAALALLCNTPVKPIRDAALLGALCGLACGFKPNFIVVAPALFWILLLEMPGSLLSKIRITIAPAASGFIVVFAIPFIWGIKHADFHELLVLYKSYTPIYISTRTDLYHYDSRAQQLADLVSMQTNHLVKMGVLTIPGTLWAWRQNRNDTNVCKRLRNISIFTFAIAWHEIIAGKYWFSHLLAPYFFAILCFSLLITTVNVSASNWEKSIRFLFSAGMIWCVFKIGMYSDGNLIQKNYDKENYNIRSNKIARYLKENLKTGDTVQSLDGSGDGQGALLLSQATTATRFVEDIPLYLQPNAPATQAFRAEFLAAMKSKPPAFFVYIHNMFHPAGGNRLKEFKELNKFLEENYVEAVLEDGEYTIYKLKKPD